MLDVPPVRYADTDGDHVAYQIVGDGPVDLLLAPGFISHLDLQWTMPTFGAYIEHLTQFGRVILFDKRGTGLSDPSPAASRFDQRVDDITAVLDAAGSKRAVLVGTSEGGPLSVLYAATHPDRVAALVLLGTFASGSSIGPDIAARFDHAVNHWGQGLTADVFVSADEQRRFARTFFGLFERASCSPGMARALLDSILRVDVTDLLPTLKMPTLVMRRRDDPFAADAWSDELEALLPDTHRVELPGSDHLPWLGDSAALADAIGDFTVGADHHRPRRGVVATVLFTDIVESTRRAVELGDSAWMDLLTHHNQVVRSALDAHRGREIKALGDGFLSLFSTPGRAVRCAERIVEEVNGLGLQVRAGLHSGEVEMLDIGDVGGLTVHIASRVGARASGGEVLVTRAVHDLLAGDSLAFRRRGAPRLKGLPDRMELYALDGRRDVPDLTTATVPRKRDQVSISLLAAIARTRRRLQRGFRPVPQGQGAA